MEIKCQYKEMVELHKLTPHPKNANKHPERQIELLAKIIDHTGFRHPIVVSKRSGFVVAGHGRLEAAYKLGVEKVPVDYQDFKDEAEEFSFLTADNKIAELSKVDDLLVIEEIKSLEVEDTELFGFDDLDLNFFEEAQSLDEIFEEQDSANSLREKGSMENKKIMILIENQQYEILKPKMQTAKDALGLQGMDQLFIAAIQCLNEKIQNQSS